MILLNKRSKTPKLQSGGRVAASTPTRGSAPNRVSYNVIDAKQYQTDLSGLHSARPTTGSQKQRSGASSTSTSTSKSKLPDLGFLNTLKGTTPDRQVFTEKYMQTYNKLVKGVDQYGEMFLETPAASETLKELNFLQAEAGNLVNRQTSFTAAEERLKNNKNMGGIYMRADGAVFAEDVTSGQYTFVQPNQLWDKAKDAGGNELTVLVEQKDGTKDEQNYNAYRPIKNHEVKDKLTTEPRWYLNGDWAQSIINGLGGESSYEDAKKQVKEWFTTTKGFKSTDNNTIIDGAGNEYGAEEVQKMFGEKSNFWFLDENVQTGVDEKDRPVYGTKNISQGIGASLRKNMTGLNMSNPVFRSIFNEQIATAGSYEEALINTNEVIMDSFREALQITTKAKEKQEYDDSGNPIGPNGERLPGTTKVKKEQTDFMYVYEGEFEEFDLEDIGEKNADGKNTTISLRKSPALALQRNAEAAQEQVRKDRIEEDTSDPSAAFDLSNPVFDALDTKEARDIYGNKLLRKKFVPDLDNQDIDFAMIPVVTDASGNWRMVNENDWQLQALKTYKKSLLALEEEIKADEKKGALVDSLAYKKRVEKRKEAILNAEYTLPNGQKVPFRSVDIDFMNAAIIDGVYEYTHNWNNETQDWNKDATKFMRDDKLPGHYDENDDPKFPATDSDKDLLRSNLPIDSDSEYEITLDDLRRFDANVYHLQAIVPLTDDVFIQAMYGEVYEQKDKFRVGNLANRETRWNTMTLEDLATMTSIMSQDEMKDDILDGTVYDSMKEAQNAANEARKQDRQEAATAQ